MGRRKKEEILDEKLKHEKALREEAEKLEAEIVYNNVVEARNDIFLQATKDLPRFLEQKNKYIVDEIVKYSNKISGFTAPVIANILSKGYYAGVSPKYTSTNLALAFDKFKEVVADINIVQPFNPTKQNFCQYLGITVATYNSYLKARENDMRETAEAIEDYLIDCTLTSAQYGLIKESTSLYRMRAEKQGHAIKETKQTIEFNVSSNNMTPQEMLEDLKSKGLLQNKN